MLTEKWTHAEIVLRNRGDETRRCSEWLGERRFIHNSQKWGTCNENCKLNRYQQGIDGYRWRCRPCNYTQSIRNGSFFEKSKFPLYTLIGLIYYWAQKTVQREIEVTQYHTIIDWYNFCVGSIYFKIGSG